MAWTRDQTIAMVVGVIASIPTLLLVYHMVVQTDAESLTGDWACFGTPQMQCKGPVPANISINSNGDLILTSETAIGGVAPPPAVGTYSRRAIYIKGNPLQVSVSSDGQLIDWHNGTFWFRSRLPFIPSWATAVLGFIGGALICYAFLGYRRRAALNNTGLEG